MAADPGAREGAPGPSVFLQPPPTRHVEIFLREELELRREATSLFHAGWAGGRDCPPPPTGNPLGLWPDTSTVVAIEV